MYDKRIAPHAKTWVIDPILGWNLCTLKMLEILKTIDMFSFFIVTLC